MERITLLHTNDLHSHLENWPKIRRYLDQRQRELAARRESVVTVDLGDFVDRWHPLSEATNGQGNIQLMNQVDYDAVTIGNNEGVGNSKDELDHLYDEVQADVLLANLFDKQTLQPPEWAQEYKILTTNQGTKIGLMAFTAPFPLTYAPNGWDIREPMEILPSLVTFLRPQVDVLVLMSHLGIGDDRRIVDHFPQIDVILGSHTHHLFSDGEVRNGVLIAAAGKFGQYIGEVSLVLEGHEIRGKKARVIATDQLLAFPEDEEEINSYLTSGHQLLQEQKVAWLPRPLSANCRTAFPIITEALKAVKSRGETEVAILNSGLFLTNLSEGVINQDQLHSCLPHPMHLIRVTLKGSEMIRLVYEMEKNRGFLRNFPIVGMGFRGKIFGEILYDGILYDDVNHQVLWQGLPIDREKAYQFTTVDHFMFVPFFPTIEIMGQHDFLFPEFIRTVLGNYLKQHYPINRKEV